MRTQEQGFTLQYHEQYIREVLKARAETRSGLRICTKCQSHPALSRIPFLVEHIPDAVEHEELVLPVLPPCRLMVVDIPSIDEDPSQALFISKFRVFIPRLLAHEQHILYYMEEVERIDPEVNAILLRAARMALNDFDANPMKVPRQIHLTADNAYYFVVFMLAANRESPPEGALGAPST